MIDYKMIADNDPGGDLTTAYQAMAVETVSQYRQLSGNELRIWAANNSADYAAIKSNRDTEVLADVAYLLIQTPDSRLSMDKAEIRGLADALVSKGIISTTGRDALFAIATEQVPVYPGLQKGHLQNAREMRAAGEI